jgi:tetratricopeptide (TPR) repeat protein
MSAKKRLPFLLLIIALFGCATISVYRYYLKWTREQVLNKPISDQQFAQAWKKVHGSNIETSVSAPSPSPLKPIGLNQPIRLALGSLGLANDEQNGRLCDLVLAELNGAQGLDPVERQSLDKVLRELNLSLSGLVRARDAVRAGKILKADWFVLGTPAKIKGTNSIVIRVVDARSGILRDAGVFSSGESISQLAEDIALFVRQSRENAATVKTPVFLAIAAFKDLSPNDRLAGFSAQLRGYLTAAYHGGKVILLEREYVDTLLQEVHLDLAGLTEDSATNAPAPMQSAYWLVSGSFQSLETTNLDVEMLLNVERMFGRATNITLRGRAGDQVNRRVKEAIDQVMSQYQERVIPGRNSEIMAQLDLGKDLVPLTRKLGKIGLISVPYQAQERNLDEGMRAFETVLLLDPGNREAKMCLASCLRVTGKADEAREYYRQIIEAQRQDAWTETAQQALLQSFSWNDPGFDPIEEARWFERATRESTNSLASQFYSKQMKEVEQGATIARGGSEGQSAVEQRLFENLQSYDEALHGRPGHKTSELGMYDFVTTFSPDRAVSAQRLAALLPKMKSMVPDMEPYLMAMIVRFQLDTNAPIIAEFQQELVQLSEHPDHVLAPREFWPFLLDTCYACFDQKLYGIVALIMEGQQRAASKDKTFPDIYHSKEEDKIALAYAYMGMEHWQQAREIFDTFSNQSVFMFEHGPWGGGLNTVLPSKQAAFCAQNLGQAPKREENEFDMGKACFCFCAPSAFVVDENGLWVGIGNQLLRLDLDLKTNLAVTLPKNSETSVCAICPTASSVWIGTEGDGLIEFDKATGKCRRFTFEDGLLMNNISCLDLDGAVLWIGYGIRTYKYWAIGVDPNRKGGLGQLEEGGLGRLDLSTRQFTTFSPSIQTRKVGSDSADGPTTRPVIMLAHEPDHDVWFVIQNPDVRLRRYRPRENTWGEDAHQKICSCVAVDQTRLFLGQYRNFPGQEYKGDQLGVNILDSKENKWRSLKTSNGLMPDAVSALAPNGNELWVGGRGYIALFDLEQDKIRKFARIQANAVDQIQLGGGYLWASYDSHLHRVLLQNAR